MTKTERALPRILAPEHAMQSHREFHGVSNSAATSLAWQCWCEYMSVGIANRCRGVMNADYVPVLGTR